ncbi:MAG: pyridoxal-phosphate dependent enzyme, partial [Acidobacteriota bacterium]
IDGNATLGRELASKGFDIILTPVGGGGLISGIITGLRETDDHAEVIGIEPRLGNDAARSLKAGYIVANESEPLTLADGARTISVGQLNWPIIRDGAADILEVGDDTIAHAVRLYFDLANLKVEPTGALTLAALLEYPDTFRDKKVCLVVSGGNVDPAVYLRLIEN